MTVRPIPNFDPSDEPIELAAVEGEVERLTSWAPVDLAAVSVDPEEPKWLRRSDGLRLLYPGRVHWISGEPEASKTWIAFAAVVEVLNAGGRVAVIDFEDDGGGFLARMQALALDAISHQRDDRLRYINPTEAITTNRAGVFTLGQLELVQLGEWAPDIAVIDGVTAAMDLEGLDPLANRDVARWLAALPRPLARAGAAVLCLDHVTKSKENRGKWAIGGQHKLAAVDGAAFTVECIRPVGRAFSQPVEGLTRLTLTKDRRGFLRGRTERTNTATIADIALTAYPDGGMSIQIEAPGRGAIDENQRRIIEHLAIYDGAAMRALRDLGNSDSMDEAIKELIAAGHVIVTKTGAAHRHSITPAGHNHWADEIAATTGPTE